MTVWLNDSEKLALRNGHQGDTSSKQFQAFLAAFCERIYTNYNLNPKKYLNIQIYPEHMFGRVTQDNRDRVVEVKKISKSDQPNQHISSHPHDNQSTYQSI